MNRESFIKAVLPAGGQYCLFSKNKNQQYGKQRFFTTIDDLLATSLETPDNDLYFGLATYNDSDSRTAVNADRLKAFFLDLDSKDFGSKKEALQELKHFCKALNLPQPSIVDSGRGIHAYWILDRAVPKNEWLRVAKRLKSVCAGKGFDADPAVTADVARILRLPDSFNHKGEIPVPCRLLKYNEQRVAIEDFAECLGEEFVPEPVLALPAGFEGFANKLMDNLAGNIEASFKQIMQKSLKGKGCNQILNAVKNNAELDEPTWRGALSIAIRCEDSERGIKAVSKDHPDYDYDKAKQKAEDTKGPYTCDYFAELNSSLCEGCPNKGKFKSPIVLGNEIKEPEVEDGYYKQDPIRVAPDLPDEPDKEVTVKIPQLPKGYVLGKAGGIYFKAEDADGGVDYKLVVKHTLYAVARTFDDNEQDEGMVFRLHMPMDGVRTFAVSNATISSTDKLREVLAKNGVLSLNQNELRKYVMTWVDHFQYSAAAKKPIRQYGWTDKECTQFVLGENIYTKDGPELALPSHRTAPYNPYFDPKGTLSGWKNTMKLWEDPRFVQQQYAMGVGFGSVLMQRDETNASILHLHSKESGVGKTAILRAITSVWGNPDSLIMQRDDTKASKMQRCEVYHNLPLALDEITNMKAGEASEMIYQLTSGQQRSRMNASSNEERVRGDVWSLMAISTGNTSILDIVCGIGGKMSPQAEGQRVVEMYIEKQFDGHDEKHTTDKFSEGLRKHYGHAGAVFVQYLMRNPLTVDAVVAKVRQAVDIKGNLSSENRFWSAQVTYAVAGLILAKKAGLVNYDAKAVLHWAVKVLLTKNKTNLTDMVSSAQDVVSEYLADNIGTILQVKDDGDMVLGDNSPIPPPEEKARVRLYGRYESGTGKLYLLATPFKQWCIERQIPYARVVAELTMTHNAQQNVQKRLGTGTQLKITNGKNLLLDWDKADNERNPDGQSDKR